MAFIDAHRQRSSADGWVFGVEPICRVLSEHGVPIAPSTYYAAKTRGPSDRAISDELLLARILAIQADRLLGRGLYGVRKMWRQLQHEGYEVARCTVARLMKAAGLQGVRRGGRVVRTTIADERADRPADLVNRDFTAAAPNRLWIVDFTYVGTWSGMAYTAFVTDVFSRRIVGWRTASHMRTELPLDALEMAIWTRDRVGDVLAGLVQHSDAGSQYTAIRYVLRLTDAGAVASIGTVGDSYDNAMAESIIGLYKTECVRHDGPFRTVEELELATLSWVHWYNEHRLHSAIDYATPVDFEEHYRRNTSQQQPRP